jgi:hypothetical protein
MHLGLRDEFVNGEEGFERPAIRENLHRMIGIPLSRQTILMLSTDSIIQNELVTNLHS